MSTTVTIADREYNKLQRGQVTGRLVMQFQMLAANDQQQQAALAEAGQPGVTIAGMGVDAILGAIDMVFSPVDLTTPPLSWVINNTNDLPSEKIPELMQEAIGFFMSAEQNKKPPRKSPARSTKRTAARKAKV